MSESNEPQGTDLEPEEVEALREVAERDGVLMPTRDGRGLLIRRDVN